MHFVMEVSDIPFFSPSIPRVSEAFGKGVVINLQLCYLNTKASTYAHC